MNTMSAAATASVQYLIPDILLTESGSSQRRADVRERYLRLVSRWPQPELLSATKLEAPLRVPPLSPWLNRVERRIENSIASQEWEKGEPGRWLNENVAAAALRFFRNTADLLPAEPFIYASREGDLVAEFSGAHGTLTTIVSPQFIILFSTVDKEPFHKKLDSTADTTANSLRAELKDLILMLRDGRHGSVGSSG